MMGNRTMEMIMDYGDTFDTSQDISMAEIMSIIRSCKRRVEMVESSYLYGHMRGMCDNSATKRIPLYNIQQMSDEEWNRRASKR